jgi:hypothetical protein
MKTTVQLAAFLLLAGGCLAQGPMPKNGYVPDEKTAVKIAEAVLSPIYGEKKIEGERPFHAVLKKTIWTVSGSLPAGWDGGVAEIRIDKRTGAILGYIHGK